MIYKVVIADASTDTVTNWPNSAKKEKDYVRCQRVHREKRAYSWLFHSFSFFFSLILTLHTGLGGTGHRAHDTFAPYFFEVSQRKMDIGNRGQGAEAKLKRKGKR